MAATTKTNIIRKVEITEEAGHHGGAWKVAYADFMTAMMAFFLLLWILSSADEQKLRGIAEYFTNATMPNGTGLLDGATFGPPGTLNASRGAIVARGTTFGEIDDPSPAQWEVMDVTDTAHPDETRKGTYKGVYDNPAGGAPSETERPEEGAAVAGGAGETPDAHATQAAAADIASDTPADGKTAAAQAAAEAAAARARELHAADTAEFQALEAQLRQAMQENPDLKPLEKNVIFERTPDGLRIQVVDQQGQPMFNTGSTEMRSATRELMEKLGESLATMANPMVISGHTDAVPFTNRKAYDNWDLSSDRANAMRRVLLKSGVEPARITRVSGMADTELLVPDNPLDPSNRRITVLLKYRRPAATGIATPLRDDKLSANDSAAPATHRTSHQAAGNTAGHSPAGTASPQKAAVASNAPDKRVNQLDEAVFENLRSALR